eukprot:Rhum_TRINITY_DN7440_c0_g1::Rhum_TRINITY_DN7440_c0_g1_i1::g.23173::m.23173
MHSRRCALICGTLLLAAPSSLSSPHEGEEHYDHTYQASESWRTRLSQGQVVGHVDHPQWIDFTGRRSYHVDGRVLKKLKVSDESEEEGDSETQREFLVKLKAPVHVEMVNEVTAAAADAGGWASHGARNTLHVYTTAGAARRIARIPRVINVFSVNDELSSALKLHTHLFEEPGSARSHDVDRRRLHVVVHPAADEEAAVAKVLAALAEGSPLHDPRCTCTRQGPNVVEISFPAGCESGDDVQATAAGLVKENSGLFGLIEHVSHPPLYHVTNQYGRAVMGVGAYNTSLPPAERDPYTYLDGAGHIVGVADTGIDHDHCFFFDPAHETPLDHDNREHRKILHYQTADTTVNGRGDIDSKKGHGTHVAGTIAGKVLESAIAAYPNISKFNGMVPEAKLAVIDMAGLGFDAEGVNVPSDIRKSLYQFAETRGARVHSNSWGSNGIQYNHHSKATDGYLVDNVDNVILFAAGNEADRGCNGDPTDLLCDKFTILSPCNSKNGICVGASMAPLESWEFMGLNNYYMHLRDAEGAHTHTFAAMKAFFGETHPVLPLEQSIAFAEPRDVCSGEGSDKTSVTNPDALKGKIAIVQRGKCYFASKTVALAKAGAIAVVIVNNKPGDPIVMGKDGVADEDLPDIPTFMISMADGKELERQFNANNGLLVDFTTDHHFNAHKNVNNVAEFSSRGPTADYRVKPDFVAIGYYVHSAASDSNLDTHNCNLASEMGTSMATPMASGIAVKIRQYVMSFHKPSFEPTGYLMKALLVQAAVPLTGSVDRNAEGDRRPLRPEASPSFYQGHGRLTLDSIIATTTGEGANTQLHLEDKASLENTDGVFTTCVQYNGKSRYGFRATLAWYDLVAGSNSGVLLVNDLDLEVTAPDGRTYLGNGRGEPRQHSRDRLNPVEKVTIVNAAAGSYKIKVTAHSLSSPQKFAVAASGAPGGDGASCPVAACRESSACGNVETIHPPHTAPGVSANVWEWKFYKFTAEQRAKSINVTVSQGVGSGDSDVNIFIRKSALPNIREFDAQYNSQCGHCTFNNLQKTDKMLIHRPDAPAPGDVYYVGVHVGCCEEATYDVHISAEGLVTGTAPTLTRLEKAGEAPAQQGDIQFTAQQAYTGGTLVLLGTNFGAAKDLEAASVTYQNNATSPIKLCKTNKWISASRIECTTQPGSFGVQASVITLTIRGYTLKSTRTVSFASFSASRYDINGLRNAPCDQADIDAHACPGNTARLHFNTYISAQGRGDVYIVGEHIGERLPLKKRPAATVTYSAGESDDDKEARDPTGLTTPTSEDGRGDGTSARTPTFTCETQAYISDEVLHCLTERGSVGKHSVITIRIHDVVVVLRQVLTLEFEGKAKITGLSVVSDPMKTTARLILTNGYVKAKAPVMFHGESLNDNDKESELPYVGKSSAYLVPKSALTITYGTYPAVEEDHMDLLPGSGDLLLGSFHGGVPVQEDLFFKVTKYGEEWISTESTAVVFVMPPARITGLSSDYRIVNSTRVSLVLPFNFMESGDQTVYIYGIGLGTASSSYRVIIKETRGGAYQSHCETSYVSDTKLACKLKTDFAWATAKSYSFDISVDSAVVHSSHVHFSFGGTPALTGLKASPPGQPGDGTSSLSFDATNGAMVVYVLGNEDLGSYIEAGHTVHMYARVDGPEKEKVNYPCVFRAIKGSGGDTSSNSMHYFACVLDPATPKQADYRLRAYFGSRMILTKLFVTVTEANPPSQPLLVNPSGHILFSGHPFTLTKQSAPDAIRQVALSTATCENVDRALDQALIIELDLPFVLPTKAVNASTAQELFNVCYSVQEGTERFWRAALLPDNNKAALGVVRVNQIALVVDLTPASGKLEPVWGYSYLTHDVPKTPLGVFTQDTTASLLLHGMLPPLGKDWLSLSQTPCDQLADATVLKGNEHEYSSTGYHLFDFANPGKTHPPGVWFVCYGATVDTASGVVSLGRITVPDCYQPALDANKKESSFTEVCGGHGTCNTENKCLCFSNYFGDRCEVTCPLGNAGNTASPVMKPCSGYECLPSGQCKCGANQFSANCDKSARTVRLSDLDKETNPFITLYESIELNEHGFTWDLYVAKADEAIDVFVHLQCAERYAAQFTLLVWEKDADVGIVHAAVGTYTSTAEDKQITFFKKLDASSLLFVGVYGATKADFTSEVPYSVSFATGMSTEVATPEPLLATVEDFTKKYKTLSMALGFAIGLVLFCFLIMCCRIFVSPVLSLFLAKQPVLLEEDDDTTRAGETVGTLGPAEQIFSDEEGNEMTVVPGDQGERSS